MTVRIVGYIAFGLALTFLGWRTFGSSVEEQLRFNPPGMSLVDSSK